MLQSHLDKILAEVDKHEAVDPDYREGWHAAIAAVRVRLAEAKPVKRTKKAKVDPVLASFLKLKFPHGNWSDDMQIGAWQRATGRQTPQRVEGPLMPPEEAGALMITLNKKKLPSLTI